MLQDLSLTKKKDKLKFNNKNGCRNIEKKNIEKKNVEKKMSKQLWSKKNISIV
jgi:hypothetical protein